MMENLSLKNSETQNEICHPETKSVTDSETGEIFCGKCGQLRGTDESVREIYGKTNIVDDLEIQPHHSPAAKEIIKAKYN